MKALAALAAFLVGSTAAMSAPDKGALDSACLAAPYSVQVLGSGGPIAEGPRASASYVVRVYGRPRLLIDAGPGAFLRLGEYGIAVNELEAIVLTHLHVDHSGDLPAILNADSFAPRTAPLNLIGPAAGGVFPGTTAFVQALFGRSGGAWRILGALVGEPLGGDENRPALRIQEVFASDSDTAQLTRIPLGADLFVTTVPVHHGGVPALGLIVESKGAAILFTGDQSFQSTGFATATAGLRPAVMIAHHAIPEGAGQPIGLHRSPASIGELAAAVGPGQLVLGHNMRRALDRVAEARIAIARHYSGPIAVADDGDCFVIGPSCLGSDCPR